VTRDAALVEVEDIVVHLVRKNVRNLRISIHRPQGDVRVSAPLCLDEASVRLAISEKAAWIRRKPVSIPQKRD
jgi:hypothetical protein